MTANPLKPVKRYRRGKAIAEEPSSEEDEDYEEEIDEQEQRRQREAQRRQQRQRQAAPKAASFPGGALTKAVQDVKIEDITDEEGFITEGDDDGGISKAPKSVFGQTEAPTGYGEMGEEDEEGEEEDTTEEDESTEDEAPRRTLLRPTFIRKDKRKDLMEQSRMGRGIPPWPLWPILQWKPKYDKRNDRRRPTCSSETNSRKMRWLELQGERHGMTTRR
jgi:microfibrillar-associated protein 1